MPESTVFELALEGETQTKLDLPGGTERVDACSYADAVTLCPPRPLPRFYVAAFLHLRIIPGEKAFPPRHAPSFPEQHDATTRGHFYCAKDGDISIVV